MVQEMKGTLTGISMSQVAKNLLCISNGNDAGAIDLDEPSATYAGTPPRDAGPGRAGVDQCEV